MRLLTSVLAATLCMAGLAIAQDVRYNYSKDTDFTQFKTYKWVEIPGAKIANQITDKDIRDAIDAEMAKKGFTKSDDANLLVGYQVGLQKQQQITAYGTGSPWGYGRGWGGYGGGITTATTSTINIGVLDLDMYDAAKKELVWRGTATKTINPSKNPDKNRKDLQKGIAKLMKDYPPKVKG